jgi:hypothetical protein
MATPGVGGPVGESGVWSPVCSQSLADPVVLSAGPGTAESDCPAALSRGSFETCLRVGCNSVSVLHRGSCRRAFRRRCRRRRRHKLKVNSHLIDRSCFSISVSPQIDAPFVAEVVEKS